MNFKTLIIRTLSGAVYVALIVAAIMINDFFFAAVFAAFSALTTFEFHKLTNKQKGVDVIPILPAAASFLIFLCFFWILLSRNIISADIHCVSPLLYIIPVFLGVAYCILIAILFVIDFFRKEKKQTKNIFYTVFGQVYIALPFILTAFIEFNFHKNILLALFVIVWIYDTFAYLIGSAIGRHRLCERISPKKSWEGFFGGLIGALAAGFVCSKFISELNLLQWLGFALVIVVFGTLGDLFESVIKRKVGVKDSGSIIPGHGGLLDRFDSMLFAAPAVFIYLSLLFI
ncbi:MAG: phosphatidate cytidylyltransferase [Paludibacter sp.]|jgi:phosphatidate cytidylyltransferase|nr:phosphatidate cytidylyltransferase [Paludibacter sp.]